MSLSMSWMMHTSQSSKRIEILEQREMVWREIGVGHQNVQGQDKSRD